MSKLFTRILSLFVVMFCLIGMLPSPVWSADESIPVDKNFIVILSDLHIGVDAMKTGYAANNDQKVSAIIDKILAMNPRPGHVLIYGDLAYDCGTVADYKMIQPILGRFDEAGIPWTTIYGNHDRRVPFAEVFSEKVAVTEIPDRLVNVVQTPLADFIMLDSLNEGTVESKGDTNQKEWLEQKLAEEEKAGRRVYVGSHHPSGEAGFLETVKAAPAVCGYICGHLHYWKPGEVDGVPHLVLPSTSYKEPPLGFVTLRLGEDKDVFTLITNDPDDPCNGQTWENIIRK